MKERPILFNSEMVRAVCAGKKTVTRRAMKHQPLRTDWIPYRTPQGLWNMVLEGTGMGSGDPFPCPYGKPGDLLYVREAWAEINVAQAPGEKWVVYRECDNRTDYGGPWKPSIHMRRRNSRILLEITDVRVERLQAITEEQARAEGITDGGCTNCGNNEPCGCECPSPSAVDSFVHLWNSTGGCWNENPWVWVVEFQRIAP